MKTNRFSISTPFTLVLFVLLAGILFLASPMAAGDPASAATTPAPVSQAAAGVDSLSPAGSTNSGVGSLSLFQSLIPFLVPGLIALAKIFAPKIPKPVLPVLAPILGAGIEIIGHYSGLTASNGMTGAILGASGVAVREIYDQVQKMRTGA